jgi:pimeloyl-ACP methyl ester carboxylesterase
MRIIRSDFISKGVRCDGDLLLPEKATRPPVLIMAGAHDSLVPLNDTKKYADKLPHGELVVMDCNHFAPYTGEAFLKHIDKQVEFLERHLM